MKLLPCPFCGSPARLEGSFDHIFVVCGDTERKCGVIPETFMYDDKERAVKEWNTRAGKDRTPKEDK